MVSIFDTFMICSISVGYLLMWLRFEEPNLDEGLADDYRKLSGDPTENEDRRPPSAHDQDLEIEISSEYDLEEGNGKSRFWKKMMFWRR